MNSYNAILLIAVLLLGCFLPPTAAASRSDDVVITDASYLKEADTELGLDEISAAFAQDKFTAANRPIVNFGIASSPVWVRLVVENRRDVAATQRLVIENSWINEIAVYFQSQDGTVSKHIAGDRHPYGQRPIKQRFFAFSHRYLPGPNIVYLRAETPDPLLLPIYLLSEGEAQATNTLQDYSYGFVYGFIIALALYNAMLFLSLRHARYFYYAVYLLLFIAMNIAYTGHGFKWLWPNAVVWQQWIIPILMMLYGFAGLRFATSFLHTARTSPRLHQFIVFSCIGFAALEVLAILFDSQIAALNLSFAFIVLFTLAMVFLGVVALRAKQKSAGYFLYASLLAMVGALLTAMAVLGVIPYSGLTYRAVEIGMLIESVLLAMALADHFRLSQEEKIKAERLAKIDPLTGLNNRRGFYETTRPLWVNARRYHRNASLILMDIDFFKRVNDTHGHMQGDKALLSVADFLAHSAREGDVLARWGGEEFILFLPETPFEQALVFAERLRESIEHLDIVFDHTIIHITASFGVTYRANEDLLLDNLISKSDKLLYRAKAEGRNRVCGEDVPERASAE